MPLSSVFIKSSAAVRTLYIIWVCSWWRRRWEWTPCLLGTCHSPSSSKVVDKFFMLFSPVCLGKKKIFVLSDDSQIFYTSPPPKKTSIIPSGIKKKKTYSASPKIAITFFTPAVNSDCDFVGFFTKSLGRSEFLCLDESNGFLFFCP